ncbi:hypothetical protein FGO68_gene6279 [Halteria grandinella]|uniref:Uncharacterized protein n=1 Tax=Halteria grandinella TaxID=5974 RepID=A0A8J8NI76_HALGN|nr:hypothetical protein FGO68_gene6279 [Halteria grandinella]
MNSTEILGDTSPLVLKLVLIGSGGVGKTSFHSRFFDKLFPKDQSTIGVDFKIQKIVKEGRECKYQVWDPSGGERFKVITQSYYRNARGLLIFVDLSIEATIEEYIDNWMLEIEKQSSDNVCKLLIGSKCDFPQKISDEACEQYAQQYNMAYFKTSAKEDINITEAMESIMEAVFQQAKYQNFQNVHIQPKYTNFNEPANTCC